MATPKEYLTALTRGEHNDPGCTHNQELFTNDPADTQMG